MSHINFYVCLDLLVIENSNHSVLIVAWLRSWSLDTCQSYQARFFSLWIETIKCFRLVLFCSNLVHKWSNETNIHKIQNSVSFTLCAEYKKNPINTDQNPHIVNSSQLVLFEEEKWLVSLHRALDHVKDEYHFIKWMGSVLHYNHGIRMKGSVNDFSKSLITFFDQCIVSW